MTGDNNDPKFNTIPHPSPQKPHQKHKPPSTNNNQADNIPPVHNSPAQNDWVEPVEGKGESKDGPQGPDPSSGQKTQPGGISPSIPESPPLEQGLGMYLCGSKSGKEIWKLCELHELSDGAIWKSGKHAFELTRNAVGQHFIKAISDSHGVFERLLPHKPYPLGDRTSFRFGQYVVEFQLSTGVSSLSNSELLSSNRALAGRPLGSSMALAFLGPDGTPCLTLALISRKQTILGRGGRKGTLTCDLSLPDESELLSRTHLMITQDGDHASLMDLGSTNGTFIWRQGKTPIVVGLSERDSRATQILSGDHLVRFAWH